jgi:hypothetical protein
MKKCKQGYYYCYKDKKCKRIPGGYRIGLGGYLRREKEEEKSEDSGETETKKNGNGNGNGGNGGNGNGGGNGGGGVSEAVMSPAQKRKDTMLKKKYDDSDMKKNFIKQYGKEEGLKIYYAYIRKQAMEEGWSDKYKKSIDCDNPKGFSQKAHCQGKKKMNEQTCPVCGFDPCQCLEGVITEKRDGKSSKDKGYSLRDWFKGGGWKQTGGKYDGKPCAKQPGQKTKPYCRDADDRAAMSKEERNKRARKKRREDPNPNRKGKAKNVTQESYSNWRTDFEKLDEVAPLVVGGAAAALAAPYLLKRFAKPQVDKMLDGATKITPSSNPQNRTQPSLQQTQQNARDIGKMTGTSGLMNTTINTSNRLQSKYDRLRSTMRDAGMPGADQNMNMRGVMMKNSYQPEGEVVEGYSDDGDKIRPGDLQRYGAPKGSPRGTKGPIRSIKDVDSKLPKDTSGLQANSYEPQGELVDEGKKDACYHKVKSRYSVWPSAYASGALVKCRKVGAKNWGNKSKKNESVDYSNWRDDFIPTEYETTDLIKADPIQVPPSNLQKIEEAKKCWKGYKKTGTQKLFGKTYNRCEKIKKEHYDWRAELEEGAAWTKKSGKNPSGGLNEKGRKSYERENPGSDLKRPSKKVGNKRRKSFCARMKGMKKKLTSKKTANDPNSRINKSLRAWNC